MSYPLPAAVRAAMASQQMQALVRCLRQGESNQDDSAYTEEFGGKHIVAPPWVHPYLGRTTTEVGHSTASGALMWLGTTFAEMMAEYPADVPDFSPPAQDFAGVAKILERGAGPAIEAGEFAKACELLHATWTSLPGGSEQNHELADVERTFVKWGGVLPAISDTPAQVPQEPAQVQPPADDQPETPAAPEGDPMALLLPFLTTILPSVISLFSSKAQTAITKATGASPDVATAFLNDLIQKIGSVVGVPVTNEATAIQAVGAITTKADPAQVQEVESHALDYLDKLAPMVDKLMAAEAATSAASVAGMNAAASRSAMDKWDMTPWLVWFAGGTSTVMVLGLLGAILYEAVAPGSKGIDTALVGLAGPLLAIAMGVWREIFAYRFDGSKDSAAQTALSQTIVEASKRG